MAEKKKTEAIDYSKIKFVVAQNKGGVGKSSTSSQILAPYLYSRNGGKKVKYAEIDNVNSISETYNKSEIMDIHSLRTEDNISLIEFLSSNENVIFDLGGNEASNLLVKEIGFIREFKNLFWVVPVSDGEQDAQNAEDTFNRILDADENAKVLFVLSRTISNEPSSYERQFVYIFGHRLLKVDYNLWDKIGEQTFVTMSSTDEFNISKILNQTIYEMAVGDSLDKKVEERKSVWEKRDNAEEGSAEYNKLNSEYTRLTFIISEMGKFSAYNDSVLIPIFNGIDKFIMSCAIKNK